MKNNKEILAELITLFVILIIMLIGLLTSCRSNKYNNSIQTATMLNSEYIYNRTQLDSAVNVDGLPNDYDNDWLCSSFIDYETNNPITYYFIYKLNKNNDVSDIYKIYILDDSTYLYNVSHITQAP